MNSATNKNNGGIGLLGWIVILSAFLLYFKTADVLMLFAPPSLNMMLGMNVDWLYGYFNAALVEGLALVLHFHPRAKLSTSAQIVKWITLGISGLCQIYDGQVVTNTIATMSDPLKLGFSYGVPLIPLFIVIMIFAIGRLPDDEEPAKPFVGVKNMLKPAFKRFWEGDKVVVQQNRVPVSLHSPEPNPEPQIHPELIRQLEEVVRQYSGNGHNGSGGSQGSNFP
jgi:TM2 domain-containing membrane protein YozV